MTVNNPLPAHGLPDPASQSIPSPEPDLCLCGAPCAVCAACWGEGGTLDEEGFPHECSLCHGFGLRCLDPHCRPPSDGRAPGDM